MTKPNQRSAGLAPPHVIIAASNVGGVGKTFGIADELIALADLPAREGAK